MSDSVFVTTEWLDSQLAGRAVQVLDVRPPFFYAQGHIPGAVSLPAILLTGATGGAPTGAALATCLGNAGIERDSVVVLYDDGASPTASRVFWLLQLFGHPRACILDGGITRWVHEGHPVNAQVERADVKDYGNHERQEELIDDLASVEAALGDPNTVIVDVRSPAEFLGLDTRAARGGHIPGAVNVDWSTTLSVDSGVAQLETRDSLIRLFETAAVTPDKHVVVHCQSGGRSTFVYAVLKHLGYDNVSNYDAGWQEWGNRFDTPIEEA